MNQIGANLSHAFTNLHVSVPVALGAAIQIIPIWWPHIAGPVQATGAVLAAYGVIAAANTPTSAQTVTSTPVSNPQAKP